MGYKASMIIVKEPSTDIDDESLLKKLGFQDYSFSGDTALHACINPGDKSINIGHYNNCLIIADDHQLSALLELAKKPQTMCGYEKTLTELYPGSEILTVACHSGVNYHLYALVRNGQRIRYKKVVSGEPLIEYGEPIEEEEKIYANSKIIDGQRMFRSTYEDYDDDDYDDDDYDNTEDQLMQEFTFGVAKRHLGVTISTGDDEELMVEIPFKKFTRGIRTTKTMIEEKESLHEGTPKKSSWLSRLFKKS